MPGTVINKEMGFTHKDFYRDIERVLGAGTYQVNDAGIFAQDGEQQLLIELGEQTHRKIALISLPVTAVTFTFDGYSADQIKAFFQLYDRIFRRGGG